MEWKNISELREAANSYLFLLEHHEFGHKDTESVTRLHSAIDNMNLVDMSSVFAQFDVHETAIIHDGIEPIMEIMGDLEKEIGDNMPKIIKEIDPDAAAVFKFSKDVSRVLSDVYKELKSHRNTDPTAADISAVEKMHLFGLGSYGDMTFDDFLKEYIIKDLSHIAQFRRLNYMISQCADELVKRDLSKYLYWRKCDEDAIKELHDAFVDFYRWYDYIAGVSIIKSKCSCDEVTTRLFSVMEWCKEHDNEFKTQLVNCPLLKDVEDLRALATHICESANNLGWQSIIGNDVMTLELIMDVAQMLDNEIVPTIKQRNPTSIKTEPTPEPQPSLSVQATAKDDATLPDFSHMKSYTQTIEFDISALYEFLIRESVINDIDKQLFADCITHAHINELWESSHVVKKRKRNLLQCLFKMLSGYYHQTWIDKCAENLNFDKKLITNPTTSGATSQFEDKLMNVLKGKSIK